jgi:hypothetical protein
MLATVDHPKMHAINKGHSEKSHTPTRQSLYLSLSIQPDHCAVSLYTQLQAAKSEEDVKDAYLKALGL